MESCFPIKSISRFIQKPFLKKQSTIVGLWFVCIVVAWATKYFPGKYNNFLIFKQTFRHVIDQLPLYVPYPAEYSDINLYGPVFSILIAPFAALPLWAGLFTWLAAQAFFLYLAIHHLPIDKHKRLFIYWLCTNELYTALCLFQFNITITTLVLLSFILIEKEKDIWAALAIMLGTFVKLYGIVGLAFFFFSRHKLKFSLSCIGWAATLFVAPMLISSPDYIISQYMEWFYCLIEKNGQNLFSTMQNVSFLGMVRKISGSANYSDLYLIAGGILLFLLPYLRIKQYRLPAFRQSILASTLLFIVLFSTGSESSTYIIAFLGVAIWYIGVPWKRSKADAALLIFAFVLTSLSPTDIFPRHIRVTYVYPYALKALPCVLIWMKLIYETCVKNYSEIKNENRI